MEKATILVIDDHPLIIEGYKSILLYNDLQLEIEITSAITSYEAFCIIKDPKNKFKFDIIFIDLALPPYVEKKIGSGEDLAILCRKCFPYSKIVFITSHAEAFVLYNLIKSLNPHGILVKSDLSPKDLLQAFKDIFEGRLYFSSTVQNQLKNLTTKTQYLDYHNRQIILFLSRGIKSKNLPDHIPLSMSAIDKRKSQIKDYLNIDKGNDEDIIREAKRKGYV